MKRALTLTLGAVCLVVLVATAFAVYQRRNAGTATESVVSTDTVATGQAAQESQDSVYGSSVSYDVRMATSSDGPTLALFGTSKTGDESLIMFIREFAKPDGSTKTVYAGFHPGTDAGSGPYFVYDSAPHTIEQSPSFTGYVDTWYAAKDRVSPDGTKFVSAYHGDEKETRTLYVVDILSGSAYVIKHLPEGETFVETNVTFGGGQVSHLIWKDAHTVEAKVYDDLRVAEDTPGTPHPLLRTELISTARGSSQFDPHTLQKADKVGAFTLAETGPYLKDRTDVTPNQYFLFSGKGTARIVYRWSDFGEYYFTLSDKDAQGVPNEGGPVSSYCVTSDGEKLFAAAGAKDGSTVDIEYDGLLIVDYPSDGCFPHLNVTKATLVTAPKP